MQVAGNIIMLVHTEVH